MKLFFLFVFPLLFAQNNYGQNVKVEVFNKTGYDLDSVYIADNYVGAIKKNSSVVSNFKEVIIQDQLPYGLPFGVIKNKTRNTELIGLCATGRHSVSTGDFKCDITVVENEFGYRLFWNYHSKAPTVVEH